jgi:putative sugar O-methyltransferase
MDGQWAVGSNAQRYQDFVWQAVTTSSGFGAFRRHPHYTPILEHVSQDQGRQFFELVTDPLIREICLESEYADTVGSPVVYEFDGRKISPSTLRYGKVLQELVDIFPDLHNMHNIIEIGVGYGGQARLVSEYVRRKSGKVRNYYLVDLLPVLNLSRLYLEHFQSLLKSNI